ncbi:MAG: hypothetical protein K2W96_11295 [Gemmataceae bacterium]|nr:hypothetical protein [Gemmataceae bacterium]
MTFTQLMLRVGELAEIIDEYVHAEGRKAHKHWPWMLPGETEPPPPPEAAELEALLAPLSDDDLFKLCGVLLVGTRRAEPDDLQKLVRRAKEEFRNRDEAIFRLGHYEGIGSDFEDGIERMKQAGHDVDALVTVPASVRAPLVAVHAVAAPWPA